MSNLQRRVLCLMLNSLGLSISSSVLSPSSFTRGLWSVTTSRSLHPKVKYRVCSNAHAIASASPSTGAYLDSAGFRKRDPASVIFQPSSQQLGVEVEQSQCFWDKKYPMPVLDQSGRKHVFFFMSKILTPSSIAAKMPSLDRRKASSSSSDHVKCAFELKSCRNGATTSPNQDLQSKPGSHIS